MSRWWCRTSDCTFVVWISSDIWLLIFVNWILLVTCITYLILQHLCNLACFGLYFHHWSHCVYVFANILHAFKKNVFAGKSDLTVDALKLHNDLQSGPLELAGSRKDASMEEDEEELNEGFSDRTSGTFLSGLSDCSNLTFRKVQRYWESNSAAHKEVTTMFLPLQAAQMY